MRWSDFRLDIVYGNWINSVHVMPDVVESHPVGIVGFIGGYLTASVVTVVTNVF